MSLNKKLAFSFVILSLIALLIVPANFLYSLIASSDQANQQTAEQSIQTLKEIQAINKLNLERLGQKTQTPAPILKEPQMIVPVNEFDNIGKEAVTSGPVSPDSILESVKPKPNNLNSVLKQTSNGSQSTANIVDKSSFLDSVLGNSVVEAQGNASSIFLQGYDSGDIELPWTAEESWRLNCGYECSSHTDLYKYLLNFSKGGGNTVNKPVLAMTDGVVVDFKNNCGSGDKYCNNEWGSYVTLQVAPDKYISYDHMGQTGVDSIGQEINRGQEIGRTGQSGYSIGEHIQVSVSNKPHSQGGGYKSFAFPTVKGTDRDTQTNPIPSFAGREGHWFVSSNTIGGGGNPDYDNDGVADDIDNCKFEYNPDQSDSNGNGIGDACEELDSDGDGIFDYPTDGSPADNCPSVPNPDQSDSNGNGIGDACEENYIGDQDNDGILDNSDNCPTVPNPDQSDQNGDGKGDVCDATFNHIICPNGQPGDNPVVVFGTCSLDYDGDGVLNDFDNCKITPNPNQRDGNNNGVGDACDSDIFKKRKLYNPLGAYFRNKGYDIPTGFAGDPVNTGNGNFFQHDTDISLPGPAKGILEDIAPELTLPIEGLVLDRTYNSVDKSDSIFGKGWSSDMLTSASFYGSENSPQVGIMVSGGNLDVFNKNSTCGEVSKTGSNDNSKPDCYNFSVATNSTGTTAKLKYIPSSKFESAELAWAETCPLPPKPDASASSFLASYRNTQNLINNGPLIADNSPNTVNGKLPDIEDPATQKPVYPDCFNFLYTDKFGNQTVYHWDTATDIDDANDWKSGLPILTKSREGMVTSYEYNQTGTYTTTSTDLESIQKAAFSHLKSISNNFGQKLSFSFDSNGRITSVNDNFGRNWKYIYDFDGNLIEVIKPEVNQTDSNTLVKTTYAYTPTGLLNLVTDPTGRKTLQNSYNDQGKVIAQSDAKNQSISIKYTFGNGIFSSHTATTQKDGTITHHHYDNLGRLIKETDAANNSNTFTYKDNSFAKTSETDRLGRTISYEYDSSDNPTRINLPDGTVTNNTFNQYSLLTSKTQAKGADSQTTNLAYEEWRLVSKSQTSLGNATSSTTKFVWNPITYQNINPSLESNKQSELPATLQPASSADLNNLQKIYTLATVTDPNNNIQTYNYNDKYQVTKVINPVDSSILGESNSTFEYDVIGRMIKRNSPNTGSGTGLTSIVYDNQDNVVQTINALGGKAQYFYYPNSLLQAKLDEKGLLQVLSYDQNKKLTLSRQCNILESEKYIDENTVLNFDLINSCSSLPANPPVYNYTNPQGLEYTQAKANLQDVYDKFEVFETSFVYDSMDRLISTTDPVGNTTKYTLDKVGNRIEIINPDESKTKYEYDEIGNQIRAEDELGRAHVYTFDELNRVKSIIRPDIRQKTLTYDAFGNITKIKDFDGNTQNYTYDDRNNLISATDKNGNISAFVYDQNNNQIKQIDNLGYITNTTFNSFNLPKTIIQANDLQINYSYNPAGQIAKSEKLKANSEGQKQINTYAYDIAGNLTQTTNPLGGNTLYAYDKANQKISQSSYNGNVNQVNLNENLIGQTKYAYDPLGRMTQSRDPQGNIASLRYSPLNQILSSVDRRGATTAYHYDIRGNAIKETNAAGDNRFYSYNLDQSLACQTTFKTLDTVFDSEKQKVNSEKLNNQLPGTSNKGLVDPNYTFDFKKIPENHPLLSGKETSCMEYNVLGQVVKTTDNLGQVSLIEYDKAGNITQTVNPKGQITKYTYDNNQNLLSITDNSGAVTKYIFDGNNRKIAQTNSKNQTTTYIYDSVSNVIASILPHPGGIQSVSAGANIDLAQITSLYPINGGSSTLDLALLQSQGYSIYSASFDVFSNQIASIDPNGQELSYSYNPANQQTQLTDAKGNQTKQEYDKIGRLITTFYPDSSKESYIYDSRNNVIKYTNRFNGVEEYSYDQNQNSVKTKTALGNQIFTTFDILNRPTKSWDDITVNKQANSDLSSNVSLLIDGDKGLIYQKTYDPNSRLITATDAMWNEISYKYDPNGRVIQKIQDSLDNAKSKEQRAKIGSGDEDGDKKTTPKATPSPLERGTEGTIASIRANLRTSNDYRYDEIGNILASTDEDKSVTKYAYNDQNNLTTITLPNEATTSFTLDSLGNQTEIKDALGRITKINLDGLNRTISIIDAKNQSTTYAYDLASNKVKTTDPKGYSTATIFEKYQSYLPATSIDQLGFQTIYQYNGMQQITQTTDKNNNTTKYSYDPNGRANSLIDAANQVETFKLDEVGNTVKNIKANNAVYQYTYDIRGRLATTLNPDAGVSSNQYDPLNRITKTTTPNQGNTLYAYGPKGETLAQKLPDGETVLMDYTKKGELASKSQVLDSSVAENFNSPSSKDDGKTFATYTYQYDKVGNLITSTDPLGAITTNQYDKVNNLIKTTDALNNSYNYTFDEIDNLSKVLDPNNASTTYTYDPNSNVVAFTDPNGNNTSMDYTPRNELTLKTDALNRTNQYFYDPNGNEINHVKADGTVRIQAFDNLNRLSARQYVKIDYQSPETSNQTGSSAQTIVNPGTFSFSYNQIDNLSKATQINDSGEQSTHLFDFDQMGRMIGQAQNSKQSIVTSNQIEGESQNIIPVSTFAYDQNSNLVNEIIGYSSVADLNDLRFDLTMQNFKPAQKHIFEYTKGDKLNKTSSFEYINNQIQESNSNDLSNDKKPNPVDPNQTPTQVNQIAFTYDNRGLLTQKQYQNNQFEFFKYDKKGRVTDTILPGDSSVAEISRSPSPDSPENRNSGNQTTGFISRVYDANDRVVSQTNLALGKESFSYDPLNRLTNYTAPNSNQTFQYDNNGNRIKAVDQVLGITTVNTFDPANQLLQSSQAGNGIQTNQIYNFDLNGNQTIVSQDNNIISQNIFDGENSLIQTQSFDGLTTPTASQSPLERGTDGDVLEPSRITDFSFDFLQRQTSQKDSWKETVKLVDEREGEEEREEQNSKSKEQSEVAVAMDSQSVVAATTVSPSPEQSNSEIENLETMSSPLENETQEADLTANSSKSKDKSQEDKSGKTDPSKNKDGNPNDNNNGGKPKNQPKEDDKSKDKPKEESKPKEDNKPKPLTCPDNQFKASYFNNQTQSGTPAYTECKAQINELWREGAPQGITNPDNFSVTWEGNFDFADGDHSFELIGDSKIKLYINDQHIVTSTWQDDNRNYEDTKENPWKGKTTTVTVPKGKHNIKVNMFEDHLYAYARLRWEQVRDSDPDPCNYAHTQDNDQNTENSDKKSKPKCEPEPCPENTTRIKDICTPDPTPTPIIQTILHTNTINYTYRQFTTDRITEILNKQTQKQDIQNQTDPNKIITTNEPSIRAINLYSPTTRNILGSTTSTQSLSYHTDLQNTLWSISGSGKNNQNILYTQAFDPFGVEKLNSSEKPTLSLPTIPSFQGSWMTNSPVAEISRSPSPKDSNSEDTIQAQHDEPKDPKQPTPTNTTQTPSNLTFSRRQYNPNQAIFLSQDPITQGISYNPLNTLNSNVRGNNQLIGTNHQDMRNVGLNPYTLGGQNSMSSREWDGYINTQCIDVANCKPIDFYLPDPNTNQFSKIQCATFEQCNTEISNFNSNIKTNANNKLNELQIQRNEINQKQRNLETELNSKIQTIESKRDQLLSNGGYYTTKTVVPSYETFAKSTAKAQVDKFASDLAFSQFCKTDTIYPYQCNTYHTALAQNYAESYSPYTSAFKKYQSLNTQTIKVHDPDAQARDWNALTNLYYQLSNTSGTNKYTDKQYAQMIQDADQIIQNINNNQLAYKETSTKYAECKIDPLCSRGIPSDIGEQAFDMVIKEDLDKCGGQRDAGAWYWRAGHCVLIIYDVVDLALAGPGPETALKVGVIQGFKKLGSKADDIYSWSKGANQASEVIDGGNTALKAGTKAAQECLVGKADDKDIDKIDTFALLFGGVEVEAAGSNCIKITGDLADVGKQISSKLNASKSRVTILNPQKIANGSVMEEIDLVGKAHFDKATGQYISTPHVKVTTYIENIDPITGKIFYNPQSYVRNATLDDLNKAIQILSNP